MGSGSVVHANWKINLFTLKTLNHDKTKLKEFVNKIELQEKVDLYETNYASRSGTLKMNLIGITNIHLSITISFTEFGRFWIIKITKANGGIPIVVNMTQKV
ncbi:uncharacterized protein OCT59_028755 [Rhizophagus irregularis]|uniref:uncharacterized protein n=1 Tax=Rhizophagus irregularis TaxID=588596 RepID=UPI0019F9EDA5|nr:hypothetical protein OCT59_028755 [Rhizophagus irregularis]GBC52613.2 kinase-like domain-containing protein [Rhizophagus irregularis DAOM 181602=DAOM 197198]